MVDMVKINKRIDYLRECIAEEGGKINQKSLDTFIDFVTDVKYEGDPQISLTPDNDIYATWETDKKHCFRFYNDGSIKHFMVDKGGT